LACRVDPRELSDGRWLREVEREGGEVNDADRRFASLLLSVFLRVLLEDVHRGVDGADLSALIEPERDALRTSDWKCEAIDMAAEPLVWVDEAASLSLLRERRVLRGNDGRRACRVAKVGSEGTSALDANRSKRFWRRRRYSSSSSRPSAFAVCSSDSRCARVRVTVSVCG
jgi:hypothetical protein